MLYDRYAPGLKTLCLRYCGNTTDAEDVLHDGFIRIIQNLHKFKIKEEWSLESWMRRIMVNTALNHIRDHAKERCFIDIDDIIDPSEEIPEDDFFTGLAAKISPAKVLDLVNQLTPGYRVVLNLYIFEEYSHREIARLLNCSESNSKSQLSRARAMFRKKANEFINKQKDIKISTHESTG